MLFITFLNSLKENTFVEVVDEKKGYIYSGSVCELWEVLACAELLNTCVLEVDFHEEHLRIRVF